MPYEWSCGAVMWVSGFAAVCSVLMTQVINQGVYSFTSRRNSIWVVLTVPLVMIFRLFLFFLLFYFFFGFMFVFLFFWVPMVCLYYILYIIAYYIIIYIHKQTVILR